MRLWHKELIAYLPNKQLLSQWRELVAIRSRIHSIGTPNHLLVNKVLEYEMTHFVGYAYLVYNEMRMRGYKVNLSIMRSIASDTDYIAVEYDDIYPDWHNDRYLNQCLANLQEKYDCGGVPVEDWRIILDKVPFAGKNYTM